MPIVDQIRRQVRNELIVAYVTFILAVCLTVARIFTRWRLLKQLGLDDLLIACALLLSIPVFAGHHIISREVPRVLEIVYAEPRADDYIVRATKHGVLVSKMIYIGVVFYASAMGIAKLSILAFYRRFLLQKPYRIILYLLFALIATFTLIAVMLHIFGCNPVEGAWEGPSNANCPISQNALQPSINSFHLITDFIILVLPAPVLLKLHVDLKRKLGLVALFSLGVIGMVVTALRLSKVLESVRMSAEEAHRDPTKANSLSSTVIMLTEIEINIVLCCASLPALASLWRYIRDPERRKAQRASTGVVASDRLELSQRNYGRTISTANGFHQQSSQEQMIPDYHDIVRSTRLDITVEDSKAVQGDVER